MIAYVEAAPTIELQGNHFRITFASGGDEISLMLTTKAFYLFDLHCREAKAKRQIADMEAQERIVRFPAPASRKARREKA